MRASFIALLVLLCAGPAAGQTTTQPQAETSSAPTSAEAAERTWSWAASVYSYLLPDEGNYGQPTVTADRGWLHLEGRFNYEDLDTGSAWIGYNVSGGDMLAWEITPMMGGVFGSTDGIAPGGKGSLTWWKLELYSEAEYVFDLSESADSFFYNWSELTFAPVDWLRLGMVTQRTRVYDTDRDIQRGLLAGISYKALNLTTYVFNPDDSKPVVVIGAGVTF